VKRVHVRATKGRKGYFRRAPRKTARRAAPKRRSVRRTARRTTRRGRLVRNSTQRWITDTHPGTGERGIQGRPMTMAERAKWTARGAVRTELKAKVAQRVRVSPLKKRAQAVGGSVKPGAWRAGVVHPVSGKPVGGMPMSARDKRLFRSDGTARKGVGAATVVKSYGLTGGAKRSVKSKTRRTGAVRKTRKTRKAAKGRRVRVPAKRTRTGRIVRKAYSYTKPARRRKTHKVARRAGVRKYRVKASKGRKSYMRRYPRKVARKTRKVARRAGVRKYRVKGSRGRKSYLRKYPKRTRKVARKTRKVARRAGIRKYRVKASRGRKSYTRRYPRKTRRVARRAGIRKYRVKASRGRRSYTRRYASKARKSTRRAGVRRYRVRKHGGGTYLRGYAKGRHHRYVKRAGARRYSRRITVRVPALRKYGKIVRKGYTYKRRAKIARNPYKRSKVRVHGYGYTRKHPKNKRVKVRGYRRSQWYPHREGGRWITQARSKALGLLTKREMAAMARRHGLRANPGSALAMLPTVDQLKTMGLIAGEGFLGFGGAIAMGRALSAVPAVTNVAGAWTSVIGNVAAGLGFWILAHFMPENEKLQEAKPYVMAGVGIAAVVNTILNLVGSNTIPSNIGQWMIPGVAYAPAALPATAGFGQIDIYEAALDGVSGIESELEHELSRMGGGDGIFGDANEGIFSGLDGTGTPVREAYAGMGEYMKTPMGEYVQTPMGADVEEAFAGSGGMGEYFKTAMSGANVQEAYSGMGEYFKAPMGAYVEEAFAGGMGLSSGQIGAEAVEQSLQTQPLMPGFRAAVQKLVRDRIATGQPLDDAFYAKLGQASASMARRKFNQRVAQVAGQPQDIGVQEWKPPVTVASVPNFRTPISDPDLIPGRAEGIEDYEGKGEDEGIFTGGEDEGIF
jgi:hypothetical protein